MPCLFAVFTITAGSWVIAPGRGFFPARLPPFCYNDVMSALSSTNPFLQNAIRRYFAKNNLPMPEEDNGTNDLTKNLVDKQKWKMLKTLPGHQPGNTWSTMKVLNKGLSPLTKSAGGFANNLKPLAKPVLVGAGAVGGGLYVKNKLDQTAKDVQETANTIKQTGQSLNSAIQPFTDIANHVGSGFAGLLGVNGYKSPEWWQKMRAYCQQWYNLFKPENQYTDPERGAGNIIDKDLQQQKAQQQVQQIVAAPGTEVSLRRSPYAVHTASFNKRDEKMKLTTNQAIRIALDGSEQFHKQASAGTAPTPDTVLQSHLRVADSMVAVAEELSKTAEWQPLAQAFRNAAAEVRKGYPAKQAMHAQLGGNEELYKEIVPVLADIGGNLLMQEVQNTYERKVAEFKAGKRPDLQKQTA